MTDNRAKKVSCQGLPLQKVGQDQEGDDVLPLRWHTRIRPVWIKKMVHYPLLHRSLGVCALKLKLSDFDGAAQSFPTQTHHDIAISAVRPYGWPILGGAVSGLHQHDDDTAALLPHHPPEIM
eukprot:CAMPEP_0177660404 /NCGR_PEP_ID=MMETSP0447-20121125/18020_1 /TAXON_ID=0 /ORGANISM="Stygamoeba regulata, Strain BSH-02190019" /LENGTH=121 /DNA_ID=CAMNT_0019165463 /DNA_START=328 /DNA_END=693 /DNA_ORIENTATION=-